MVMSGLAGVASAVAPGLIRGVANYTGNALKDTVGTQMGAYQGKSAGIGNAQSVVDYIKNNNLQLTPEQQAHFSQALSQQDADFQQGMSKENAAFGAGLGNQVANLNNQRTAGLNAQQNAANLAQTQIQTAAQRANTNANAINQAMGMFATAPR